MQVLFESRDPEALVLRGVVVSRARFVMRRLVWLAPRARVRLTDVNGPRGGVDKRCQVELRAAGGAPVVVTSVARDWRSALDAALMRAAAPATVAAPAHAPTLSRMTCTRSIVNPLQKEPDSWNR
jgi:hypothetical protein